MTRLLQKYFQKMTSQKFLKHLKYYLHTGVFPLQFVSAISIYVPISQVAL